MENMDNMDNMDNGNDDSNEAYDLFPNNQPDLETRVTNLERDVDLLEGYLRKISQHFLKTRRGGSKKSRRTNKKRKTNKRQRR